MPELEELLAQMGNVEPTGPAPLPRPPLIPGEQRLSEPTEDDAVLTDILREMAAPPPRGAIRRALAGAGEAMLGTPGKIAEGAGIAFGSEGLTELGQSIQPTPGGILPYVQPGEEGVAANLGRAGGSGLALAPLAALGPMAGTLAVTGAATAQAIPDAFYGAKAAGEDDDEAYRAALVTAIPQGLIESVLGPERLIGKIAGAMAKADKLTGGAGRAFMVSGLGEGGEELAQSVWGDTVAQVLYDEAPNEDWKSILKRGAESGLYGVAGGLMLGSVALGAQRIAEGRGTVEPGAPARPEPAQPIYSPLEREATPEEDAALERWKTDRKATRAEFVERPEAEEAVALARKTGATVLFVDDDAAGDAAIEGMEVGRKLIILPAKADPATALLATATHESVHALPDVSRQRLIDDLTAVFPKEAKALAASYKARAEAAGKKVGGETLKEEAAADLSKALAPVVRRVMTDRATAVRVMGQRPGLMIRVLDTVRGAFGATKIADRMQKELDTLAEVRDEIAAGIEPRQRIAAAIRIVKAYDGIKAEMSVPIRIRKKQEAKKGTGAAVTQESAVQALTIRDLRGDDSPIDPGISAFKAPPVQEKAPEPKSKTKTLQQSLDERAAAARSRAEEKTARAQAIESRPRVTAKARRRAAHLRNQAKMLNEGASSMEAQSKSMAWKYRDPNEQKSPGDRVRLEDGREGTVAASYENGALRVRVQRPPGRGESAEDAARVMHDYVTVQASDVLRVEAARQEKPQAKADPVTKEASASAPAPARVEKPVVLTASKEAIAKKFRLLSKRQTHYMGHKGDFFGKNADWLAANLDLRGAATIYDMYAGGGTYGLTYAASGIAPDLKRVVINEVDNVRRQKFDLARKHGADMLDPWDTSPLLIELRNIIDRLVEGNDSTSPAALAIDTITGSGPASGAYEQYLPLRARYQSLSMDEKAALLAVRDVMFSGRTADVSKLFENARQDANNVQYLVKAAERRGIKVDVVSMDAIGPEAIRMVQGDGRSFVVLDPPYHGTASGNYSAGGKRYDFKSDEFLQMNLAAAKEMSKGNAVLYNNSATGLVQSSALAAFGPSMETRVWARKKVGAAPAQQEFLGVIDNGQGKGGGSRGVVGASNASSGPRTSGGNGGVLAASGGNGRGQTATGSGGGSVRDGGGGSAEVRYSLATKAARELNKSRGLSVDLAEEIGTTVDGRVALQNGDGDWFAVPVQAVRDVLDGGSGVQESMSEEDRLNPDRSIPLLQRWLWDQAEPVNESQVARLDVRPSGVSGRDTDIRYSVASEAGAAPDEVAAARKAWKEQGTESPWFKRWFGDSKVVDAEGKPLVVYHGTGSIGEEPGETFTRFGGMADKFDHGRWLTSMGDWFTDSPSIAGHFANMREDSQILPVYLRITKPFEVDTYEDLERARASSGKSVQEFAKHLMRRGYDGVIIERSSTDTGVTRRDYVTFLPNQIKSATGNLGTFSPESADIRYSLAQTSTPEFKRWFGDSKVVDGEGKPLVVYHGTKDAFTTFDIARARSGTSNTMGPLIYVTEDAEYAARERFGGQDGGSVMPLYVRSVAPIDAYAQLSAKQVASINAAIGSDVLGDGWRGDFADAVAELGDADLLHRVEDAVRSIGGDSIKYNTPTGSTFYALLEPTQIKSATGNSGAFDPENPDIRFSIRSDIEKEVQKVAQGLGREGYQLANAGTTLPERGLRAAVRSMMAPEYVPDTETESRVQRILNDPQARTDVLAAGISGEPLNTEQTVALDRMAKAQAVNAWSQGSEEDMGMAQATEVAFQQQRTEQARTMGTGLLRDSMQTPMERAMKLLLTPSRKVQRKLAKAETWQARRAILREEAKKIMQVRYALAERGFDPRLITDEYFKDPEFRSTWARAVADTKGGSPADWYISWRRASMLSAPITAIRNLSGNTAYTGYDRVLRLAADSIVPGSKTETGDVAEYVKVLLATFPEAWSNARDAYRDFYVKGTEGTSLDDKANLQGGKIRTAVEGVGIRVNVGTDAFFKTILGAAEIRLRSRQMARAKGGVAEDYEHDPDVLKLAKADMERALFLDRDKLTRAIVLARNWADETFAGIPVGSTIVPFASTPTQLVRRSGEALLGPAAALWRKEEKGGTALLGAATWAAMIWAASLFDDDDGMPLLTGSRDWGGEGEFQGRTAPAYSMRIGDSYYSYQQIQPLSTALAAIVDGYRKGTPMESIGSFVKAAKDQSFFRSIEIVWDAVQGVAQGERGLNRAGQVARDLLWTPMIPNVIRAPVRAADEVRRKELGDPLEQRDFAFAALPIAALGPPLKHDLWGRPVEKEGASWVGRVFGAMPMTQAAENVERVDALLGKYYSTQEKPSYFSAPETYVTRNKQRIDWTEDEYSVLTREAGTRALERIRPWVSEKDSLTKGEVEYIGKVISATRAQVANELLQARNPE